MWRPANALLTAGQHAVSAGLGPHDRSCDWVAALKTSSAVASCGPLSGQTLLAENGLELQCSDQLHAKLVSHHAQPCKIDVREAQVEVQPRGYAQALSSSIS